MPKETTHELSRLRTLELKREKKQKRRGRKGASCRQKRRERRAFGDRIHVYTNPRCSEWDWII